MLIIKLIKNKKILINNKQTHILFYYIILLKQTKLTFNKNNYIKYKNINNIFSYLFYIFILLKYKKLKINLNIIKNNVNLKYKLHYKKTNIFKNYQKMFIKNLNLIEYIININLLNSNIIINITDLKGTLIISYSSGLLNFKGKQKTKHLALTNIVKKMKYKTKHLENKNFAIHLKGIKKNRIKIINELKKNFIIKLLILYNLSPHNGCRPKKMRRKK